MPFAETKRGRPAGEAVDDPELFLAMEELEIVAQGVVEGAMQGMHRSPYLGFSAEFDAHREYRPGDDLRYVNWNLWARTDRLYVKQFKCDTNLDLYLLLDGSRSMLSSNGPSSKWAYGARAAAALAYVAMLARDAPGLYLLGEGVAEFIPPRLRPDQFREIIDMLEGTRNHGGTSLARGLEEALYSCRRRGIVVLISDLFDDEDAVLRGVSDLRFYGHEVVVVHVLDPWELELPEDGQYEFRDLETGEILRTDTRAVRASCTRDVSEWRERLKRHCDETGIDWLPCTTADPLRDLLIDYLLKRAEM